VHGPATPQARLPRVAVAVVLGLVVAGCATPPSAPSSAGSTASATAVTASPSASPAPSGARPSTGPVARASFDPKAALVTTFASKIFVPGFRLKMPAGWIAIERDSAAFQVYFGEEDDEITIDHTYRKPETPTAAMARLLAAPSQVTQGEPRPITIGGKAGLTVVVDTTAPVTWSDSGFHTNRAGLRVRLITAPVAGGETVSIFVVANTRAEDFAAVDEIGLRILATLEWVTTP
jgi:hypothetical protein